MTLTGRAGPLIWRKKDFMVILYKICPILVEHDFGVGNGAHGQDGVADRQHGVLHSVDEQYLTRSLASARASMVWGRVLKK